MTLVYKNFRAAGTYRRIRAATIWDRRIKINKIQIGIIDIWNYGAYLNGGYT